MRLIVSLLAAVGLHGALFGAAAIAVRYASGRAVAAAQDEVEVQVVAPRPDPIADAAPAPATAPARVSSEAARPHARRRVPEAALVEPPAPSDGSPDPEAPAIAASEPAPGPAIPASPAGGAPPAKAGPPSGGALLSAKPRYRTNPTPEYPIPSRRRREEGIVLLDVQVRADGTPATVSLNRSCGHPLLDRAALDAVRRWTFEPARAAGVPVSSLVVIPVRFSLTD